MKKFKFKLETVLKYREMIEEQEKIKLAQLNAEMFRLTSELEQLRILYKNEISDFEQSMRNGIKIQEISGKQVIIKSMEYAIENKLKEISEQQKLINRQMAVVVKATQDKKVIEKLKERSLKRYKKTLLKANERFIEEFISYKSHVEDLPKF